MTFDNQPKLQVSQVLHGHEASVLCLEGGDNLPKSCRSIYGHDLLISGSEDRTVRLWDLRTNKVCRAIRGFTDPVGALLLNRSHKARAYDLYVGAGNQVTVLDLRRTELILNSQSSLNYTDQFNLGTDELNQLAADPHHPTFLLGASDDGHIYRANLTNPSSGNRQKSIVGTHSSVVASLATHPKHQQVWSGGMDHHVKAWTLNQTSATYDFDMDEPKSFTSGGSKANKNQPEEATNINPRFVNSLQFDPSGLTLVGGLGDGSLIRSTNVTTKPKVSNFIRWTKLTTNSQSHSHMVIKTAFINNEMLISGSVDGTVKIFELGGSTKCKLVSDADLRRVEGMKVKLNTFMTLSRQDKLVLGTTSPSIPIYSLLQ